MESKITGWVRVGRVGRPHGLDGSFLVEEGSEAAERFAVGTMLHVGGKPARVVASKRAGRRSAIRLDRPVERGALLEVARDDLPSPEEGTFYAFQLEGLAVEEQDGRALGRVAAVVPGVANDVLELENGLALPLVEACVREVDLAGGRIVVAPGFAEPL